MSEERRKKFKGYSEEAYQYMDRIRACPLGKERHNEAIQMYAEGWSIFDIAKALQVSSNSIRVSARFDPVFKERWEEAKRQRTAQVGELMLNRLLQGDFYENIRYEPKRDDFGRIIYNDKKEPIWLPVSKEVRRKPAPETLVQFFLRAIDPKYGAAGTDQDELTITQLQAQVRGSLANVLGAMAFQQHAIPAQIEPIEVKVLEHKQESNEVQSS